MYHWFYTFTSGKGMSFWEASFVLIYFKDATHQYILVNVICETHLIVLSISYHIYCPFHGPLIAIFGYGIYITADGGVLQFRALPLTLTKAVPPKVASHKFASVQVSGWLRLGI